ncbi:MAG TPA: hypothetical protein VGL56_00315 [Fimbriimonadaceae bacterium]|jgi:hypothetical protein
MIPERIIEGTGKEIAKYTKAHPNDRFQLIVLQQSESDEQAPKRRGGPDLATLKEIDEFKRSLRGKMGVLPLEATSTEALYD